MLWSFLHYAKDILYFIDPFNDTDLLHYSHNDQELLELDVSFNYYLLIYLSYYFIYYAYSKDDCFNNVASNNE